MTSEDKKNVKLMIKALTCFSELQGAISETGWLELCEKLADYEGLPTWNEINSFCEALTEICE
jgi:hypothetical protein